MCSRPDTFRSINLARSKRRMCLLTEFSEIENSAETSVTRASEAASRRNMRRRIDTSRRSVCQHDAIPYEDTGGNPKFLGFVSSCEKGKCAGSIVFSPAQFRKFCLGILDGLGGVRPERATVNIANAALPFLFASRRGCQQAMRGIAYEMHRRFRLCDQSAQADISRGIKSSDHKVKHSPTQEAGRYELSPLHPADDRLSNTQTFGCVRLLHAPNPTGKTKPRSERSNRKQVHHCHWRIIALPTIAGLAKSPPHRGRIAFKGAFL